jgi:peptidase E
MVQESFISSYRMDESWQDVLLSMDGIVVSGGNTLNQQAIWSVQGIDDILREAWNRGIVLGGASAGSLCWFEEGTTDSRPQKVTKIECLGLLRGSHSPHYDAEAVRRPTYQRLIRSGELKPGYACDNDAGIYFVDNEVGRVIKTRAEASVYYVALEGGKIVETELPAEMID